MCVFLWAGHCKRRDRQCSQDILGVVMCDGSTFRTVVCGTGVIFAAVFFAIRLLLLTLVARQVDKMLEICIGGEGCG